MKKQNPEKQAYQAPVVRSVEFKVENGFTSINMVPQSNMTESVTHNTSYGGDYFSFGWGSNND